MSDPDNLGLLAEAALDVVRDGFVLGLGSGRAANAFVDLLGQRVRKGLKVRGVATSRETAEHAARVGIPLTTLEEAGTLDVVVDGADEVDPRLNLIKGLGGALVREKIVAASARRLVILVGKEKLVPVLGSHGVLPVEVVPFGMPLCRRRLTELGYPPNPRTKEGQLFVSDNGNHILDCRVTALARPREVQRAIKEIPGVVGTGLFLGMASLAYVLDGEQVTTLRRP